MKKADFITYLVAGSYHAVKYAENFVRDKLSYDFHYIVRLNQSCDKDAREENDLYPEDDQRVEYYSNFQSVGDLLSRNSKVPEWINISVYAADKKRTLLELTCCGRYTSEDDKMYYSDRGQGPFGIKSPALPPGFSPESGKRFRLPRFEQMLGGELHSAALVPRSTPFRPSR